MASLNFNANDVAPQQDFAPIPAGEYVAQITDSEMKATANNAGQYLELVHQIIDGPFKGRLVWARLNLDNPNAQTVQIAQQQLSAICHAVDIMTPRDSVQLHNKPLVIRVDFIAGGTVDKRGRTRERDSNEIRAWKKLDGPAPAVTPASTATAAPASALAAQPTQAQPAAAVSAGGRPAWAAKPAA